MDERALSWHHAAEKFVKEMGHYENLYSPQMVELRNNK